MIAAGSTPTLLLEREGELEGVAGVLRRAGHGRGGLLLVEGPAGIGKTAILGAAAALASSEGMRVLRAHGAVLEREFAFGIVRQLFEPPLAQASAEEALEVLQGPAGQAAELLGLPKAPGTPDEAHGADPSFTVLHGLYWLCANLAAQRPLLLSIDDGHWADASSLRFLTFLMPRLEELPVALLIAMRPEELRPVEGLLAALAADASAERVRPAPLSRSAVGRIVAERLATVADPAFEAACHDATGGTPFLVNQLAGALRERGIAPNRAGAALVAGLGGSDVGRWLGTRLASLGRAPSALARAVAVLESGPLHLAAALAGLETSAAADAADTLSAAAILEPGRRLAFVHPIVRAGVYGEIPAGERSAAHRRAAELLARDGSPRELVAEHLMAGEPAGDPWVAECLVEAARAAAGRGAPESATAYLRRALAESPASGQRVELLLELGLVEFSAGDPQARRHLEEACELAAPGPERVAAATVHAHVLARLDQCADALAAIDGAAITLGPEDEELANTLEEVAVAVGLLDAATAATVERRMHRVRARAEQEPSPSRNLLGVAAIVAGYANEPAEVTADLALRTLAAPHAIPDASDLPWFSAATIALVWSERFDEVVPVLDAGAKHARAAGDAALLAVCLSYRAWVMLRRGDLIAAEADARAAIETPGLPAPPLWHALAAGILVDSLVEQGRLEEADAVLAATGATAERETQTGAVLLHSRGRLRLAQHRPREALADLLAARDVLNRTLTRCRNCLPSRSDRALAHLAVGDRDAALRTAEEDLGLARELGAPGALGVALCAAGVATGGDAGERLVREAVASLELAGAAVERARAQTELGAMLRRGNRRTEARRLLLEALDTAHRARARPLVQRAETELRATGAKPRKVVLTGLESLTASERRVAELAREGLTNREIAQTLFVTVRTVEGHLTSVFRKLDLASRDELADALQAPLLEAQRR